MPQVGTHASQQADSPTLPVPAQPRAMYSPEGAAQYLSCSRAHLYRLIAQGRLVGFRWGRLRRFSRAELDRVAAAIEAESTATAATFTDSKVSAHA